MHFLKKFLYTYIFHVENVKIESRSLFVDWYYLFSLYNHNQKPADTYNRSVHVVKMRRQGYEHLTRYGKYSETISDILDRVFNEYDSFIEQAEHKKLEELIKKR